MRTFKSSDYGRLSSARNEPRIHTSDAKSKSSKQNTMSSRSRGSESLRRIMRPCYEMEGNEEKLLEVLRSKQTYSSQVTVFEPINTDRESYMPGVSGHNTMRLTELVSKKSTSKLNE